MQVRFRGQTSQYIPGGVKTGRQVIDVLVFEPNGDIDFCKNEWEWYSECA
jgi:hypothetical protein